MNYLPALCFFVAEGSIIQRMTLYPRVLMSFSTYSSENPDTTSRSKFSLRSKTQYPDLQRSLLTLSGISGRSVMRYIAGCVEQVKKWNVMSSPRNCGDSIKC